MAEYTFVHDPELATLMAKWKQSQSIRLVLLSNKLCGTLPSGARESETYALLDQVFDSHNDEAAVESDAESDTETDRCSTRQLILHLRAFQGLTAETWAPLTTELIKSTHRTLMNGLSVEGKKIKAGEYREEPVRTDNYSYPDYACIPQQMEKIVTQYNKKFNEAHYPFNLAS
jgi:Fic family protein